MCGLAGYWGRDPYGGEVASAMARRIEHRGPDAHGVWADATGGPVLSHCRLSIIDPSPAGQQPMVSPCGRYVLSYNGEIYNHLEVREELEVAGGAFNWRGYSDTETLLAALRYWSVPEALSRLNGMFAFALWDASERTLFLARDRMGEKPLYYGRSGDAFLFGSELKALKAHPEWQGEVDREALSLYMRYKYVPSPWSIYKGIYKIPPAHYLQIRDCGRFVGDPKCYWSLSSVVSSGLRDAGGDAETMIDELEGLLGESVSRRMVSDVPLGAFLSGGIDSSTVVALMQARSEQPVKTFSVGFHEEGFDEARHARAVAEHLGTDHTELYVSAEEAMEVIPKLPVIYDEPFAGSSQIPTYLISKLARKYVTVSVSGDGGDELFAGYNRHIIGPKLWGKTQSVPRSLRSALSACLRGLSSGGGGLPERILGISGIPHPGLKLDKLASAVSANDGASFYRDLISLWKQPEQLVIGGVEPGTLLDDPMSWPSMPGLREQMLYWDMMTYLPDEILAKLDRATMAVSLEGRIPMLDHKLVEFSWRVPSELKQRDGKGKWLLRQVLYRHLPRKLMDRPKMGFSVPIQSWLRGPLRGWAESLLEEGKLRSDGFFDATLVRQVWESFLLGQNRKHHELWAVLMFQAWLDENSI